MRCVFSTQGDVDGSPVVCGDKVIFGSNDGKLYLVNLDIGKPVSTSPAVANGLVIIAGDDGVVYAFGAKKVR